MNKRLKKTNGPGSALDDADALAKLKRRLIIKRQIEMEELLRGCQPQIDATRVKKAGEF